MRTRLLASAAALSLPMALVGLGTAPANAGSGVACGNYPTFGNFAIRVSAQRVRLASPGVRAQVVFGGRLTRDGDNCSGGRVLNFQTSTTATPPGTNPHNRTVGSQFPSLGLATYTVNVVNAFSLTVIYNGSDGSATSRTINVSRTGVIS